MTDKAQGKLPKAQGKLPLEDTLSYWKAHVSVHDVLASELSYSLIYDNIHPDRVSDALATVGLTSLPNRFFLVQVDDYQNYVSKLRPTQEYFQKTALMNIVRKCMRVMAIRGFVANLIGQDNFICYLCCDAWEGPGINEHLYSAAKEFKRCVRSKSPYTISICISGQCDHLSRYSKMYPRMNLALSKTYFTGKEVSILLEEQGEEAASAKVSADLNGCYLELLVSISRRNREHFEQVLQTMITALLESYTAPQRVRLEMIRLMQRVGEYCIRCGVPEKRMLAYNEAAMNRILACRFIADTRNCFQEYYEQAAQALEECGMDTEYSFKAPVEEYIAEHYHETIQLGDIARIMGFSEGHFARTFRKRFDMTFVQYLTDYRIEQSKKLLTETHISIEQIAYRVGINSYSYFCTCFKRSCGISPGSYRGNTLSQRQK